MVPASDSPGIRIPPPVVMLLGFLAGMALDALLGLPGFDGWRGLALLLILLGLALGLWGGSTFVRHHTCILPHHRATTVVTSGPYRFSRNPMYVGFTLVYLGVAVALGRIGPILTVLPALFALYVVVIRREERYLAAKFGSEYEEYRRAVRRWL